MSDDKILIIDSSYLRTFPLFEIDSFQEMMNRLSSIRVSTYIPEIIKNEVSTGRKERNSDLIDEITNKLAKLERGFPSKKIKVRLNNLHKELLKIKNEMEDIIVNDWDMFKLKACVLDFHINESNVNKVFEAYFAGGPPFQKIKNRDDIPDAFIYFFIKKMKTEFEEINVISKDKNLNKNLENIGVKIFEDLNLFIEDNIDRIIDHEKYKDSLKYYNILNSEKDLLLEKYSVLIKRFLLDNEFSGIRNSDFNEYFEIIEITDIAVSSYNAGLFWRVEKNEMETKPEFIVKCTIENDVNRYKDIELFFAAYFNIMFKADAEEIEYDKIELIGYDDIFSLNAI